VFGSSSAAGAARPAVARAEQPAHPEARPRSTARPDPAATLPAFPWDTIETFKATAAAHPGGIVDLSVGTPVDHVPVPIRAALADASDSPGYPQVRGTAELRHAYADWLARSHGVDVDPDDVLPTIGSKELVSSLPAQLGMGPGDTVVIPQLAYPTYEVGARMAGAQVLRADSLTAIGPEPVSLIWLNSPSNPTGKVLPAEHLAKVVSWARARGVLVASDECYLDLGWETPPLSILHPDGCGSDHRGLLAVHSLSKRSNLAGYRLGFVSGDPVVVRRLLALRKHLGLMVPMPVQAAGVVALGDDAPVLVQRSRYAQRRDVLAEAFGAAGFTVQESQAGLYLWCTRGEPALDSVEWLAERGVLVAPGTFYGPSGARHIRVAFTATDERVAAAATRLSAG
jgi:succinyldiaminopimelate transaminase